MDEVEEWMRWQRSRRGVQSGGMLRPLTGDANECESERCEDDDVSGEACGI